MEERGPSSHPQPSLRVGGAYVHLPAFVSPSPNFGCFPPISTCHFPSPFTLSYPLTSMGWGTARGAEQKKERCVGRTLLCSRKPPSTSYPRDRVLCESIHPRHNPQVGTVAPIPQTRKLRPRALKEPRQTTASPRECQGRGQTQAAWPRTCSPYHALPCLSGL